MSDKQHTYYVSEIFESIQGEGNFAGVYALFIRFQYCNLTCSWCDTKYTWTGKSGVFKEYNAADLKTIIGDSKAHHIVFTGGEPTLFRLDELVVDGKQFHVETNGTTIPTESLDATLNDGTCFKRGAMQGFIIQKFNWVVSPKMANARQSINERALDYWSKTNFNIFKFIIQSMDELYDIDQFISQYNIAKHKVYIGFEGTTPQSQVKPNWVDAIVKHGFNYSPRLHVMLWGNERGK